MNQNGMTLINGGNKLSLEELDDLPGGQHNTNSNGIPLRKDAFTLPDDEKIRIIASHLDRKSVV